MAKRPKLNGWMVRHRIGYVEKIEPVVPSRWEMMLRKLDVKEEEILDVLRKNDDRTKFIRMWIDQNVDMFFVPEKVLIACRVIGKWTM